MPSQSHCEKKLQAMQELVSKNISWSPHTKNYSVIGEKMQTIRNDVLERCKSLFAKGCQKELLALLDRRIAEAEKYLQRKDVDAEISALVQKQHAALSWIEGLARSLPG